MKFEGKEKELRQNLYKTKVLQTGSAIPYNVRGILLLKSIFLYSMHQPMIALCLDGVIKVYPLLQPFLINSPAPPPKRNHWL